MCVCVCVCVCQQGLHPQLLERFSHLAKKYSVVKLQSNRIFRPAQVKHREGFQTGSGETSWDAELNGLRLSGVAVRIC